MSCTMKKFQCSSHVGFLLISFIGKFQHLQTTSNCIGLFIGSRYRTCTFAKKSLKKRTSDGAEAFGDLSDDKIVQNDKLDTVLNPSAQNSNSAPSRNAVLQACIITSGLIAALGILIRQVRFHLYISLCQLYYLFLRY